MNTLEEAFEQASRNMLTALVHMQILPRCQDSGNPEFHKQIREYLLAHDTLLSLIKEYGVKKTLKPEMDLKSYLKK